MAELSERQLVYSFLRYLEDVRSKEYSDEDTINVCIQCLSDQYNIDLNNESHQKELGVCPNLLELFKSTYPPKLQVSNICDDYKDDERFQQFISALKERGYFKTDNIYDEERLEKAILKYKAKYESTSTQQETEPSTEHVPTEEERKEAESLKEQGNAYLIQKEYESAAECYSKAIELDGHGEKSHIYYSNRAAAYMYMNRYEDAIKDCEISIKLCPTYMRAYTRLGRIYTTLKEYDKATKIYDQGLHYEPTNKSLLEGKEAAIAELNDHNNNNNNNDQTNSSSNPGNGPNLFSGLGNILNDPNMRQQFSNAANSLFSNNNNSNEDENEGNNGGFNLNGLLNDPNIRSMAQNVLNNPEMMSNILNTVGGLFGGGANANRDNSNPNYYS